MSRFKLHTKAADGFTLLELLVVITIIVLLLSLLTPAIDRAIYQAELAMCGANLNTIAKGCIVYASSEDRFYPYRSAVALRSTIEANDGEGVANDNSTAYEAAFRNRRVNTLMEAGRDDRDRFAAYMPLKAFADPMSGGNELDFDVNAADLDYVMSDYAILAGMEWDRWGSMNRMGKKMHASGHRFLVLAADLDVDASSIPEFRSLASHPDKEGYAAQVVRNNVNRTIDSGWYTYGNQPRGVMDTNQAFADGSVVRFADVRHNEWMNSEDAADEGEPNPETFTHRFTDMTWQANGDWGRGAIQLYREDGENNNLHTESRTPLQVNP